MGKRLSKPGFAERLTALAKQKGGTAALAQSAGISKRTLEKWLAGETQPKADALKKIASSTSVDLNWLVTGEGTPTGGRSDEFVPVPLLDVRAAAGAGAWNERDVVKEIIPLTRAMLRQLGAPAGNLHLIEAIGESMSPLIEHGDLLLVDANDRLVERGGVFVLRSDQGLQVKRIRPRPEGKISVTSENPLYAREDKKDIAPDDIDVIGRVLAFMRRAR